MADNLVPLRTSRDHRPAGFMADYMTKIAVAGQGAVIMGGPLVLDYAAPEAPCFALPNNIAFWMKREGRH